MLKSLSLIACAGVSMTAVAMTAGAHAQTATAPATPDAPAAESGALQEVVVTAQRRAQNLQKVPIAVTSFDAKSLSKLQVLDTRDLGRLVPNMFASQNVGQSSANVYYIRGLGQTQSFPTFEPQVGTYVDDIYIARQNANNFALFGVDQLQVLRGPQGTLFGRNSTGGAILVTLQKPQSTFGGTMDASYGAYQRFAARASVDMPLSDQVLTRTSVYGVSDAGYVKDVTTNQTVNKTRNYGVREALTILPKKFSNVEWDVSADYQHDAGSNYLNFLSDSQGANGSDRIAYSGYGTGGGALAPYLTGAKSKLGQGVVTESFGFASNLKVKLDAGTLNVISGFRGLSTTLNGDFADSALGPVVPFDQTPYGQFTLAQALRSFQYSQEVKWTGQIGDRLNYTMGAFYMFETNRDNYGAVLNFGPLFGTVSFPFPFGDEYTKNETISEAVYAQGDYKLTEKLSFTLGGRFTHELKSVLAAPNAKGSGFTTADIQANGYKTNLSTDQFTPRLALQYQFTPQIMGFASATRGFQGGGWNGLAFTANTYNDFGPETVWSYETGFRTETPDRKLRFNGTFFYEDVSSYQLLTALTQAASFVTSNGADLEAYGAEFDVTWKPIDHLTLSGNVGLIRALYFNPTATVRQQEAACAAKPGVANANCNSGIVRGSGRLADPTYTPPVTAAGSATYDFQFEHFTLSPTISVQYAARQNVDPGGSAAAVDKSRTLLDLGVTYAPREMPFKITAECKNCTMVDYSTTYLFGYNYYNLPGTWDISVSYKF